MCLVYNGVQPPRFGQVQQTGPVSRDHDRDQDRDRIVASERPPTATVDLPCLSA